MAVHFSLEAVNHATVRFGRGIYIYISFDGEIRGRMKPYRYSLWAVEMSRPCGEEGVDRMRGIM